MGIAVDRNLRTLTLLVDGGRDVRKGDRNHQTLARPREPLVSVVLRVIVAECRGNTHPYL